MATGWRPGVSRKPESPTVAGRIRSMRIWLDYKSGPPQLPAHILSGELEWVFNGYTPGAPEFRGCANLQRHRQIAAHRRSGSVWSCPAAPAQAQATTPPDTACKLCHVDNEGEIRCRRATIQLGIDLPLSESVHGAHAAESVTAWTAMRARSLPHQPNPYQSSRRISLNCGSCRDDRSPQSRSPDGKG